MKHVFVKLPDLERSISRIHSKNCKLKEFLNVLDAFKIIFVNYKIKIFIISEFFKKIRFS